jgi:hypothetical protein
MRMISGPENDKIVALMPGAAGESGTGEDLPYAVELWDQQSANVERVIARAASGQLARAIFDSACKEFPGRRITLRRGAETVLDSAKS